jgi:two-component system, cell cycle response regulator
MITIKDIMITDNLCVELTDSMETATQRMYKNKTGMIVVLSNKVPIGILTQRDILKLSNKNINLNTPIEKFLSFNHIITVNSKRSTDYALHVLLDNNIRHLVVVDDFNHFLGAITQDMLIKSFEEDTFRTNLIIANFLNTQKRIISLHQDKSLHEAFEVMNLQNIGSLIALDDENKAVGILTETDSIYIMTNKIDLDKPIKEFMSSPVVTVYESAIVKDVVDLMSQKAISRILVLEKESQIPLTLLSSRDIAHNLKGNYGKLLESRLKHVKSTLNHIGEFVIEIFADNNEHIIQWMNSKALNCFGNLNDQNILSLIKEHSWNEILENIKVDGKCNRYKLAIKDKYFEVLCSYHYINNRETVLLILRDISKFEEAVQTAQKLNHELQKEVDILQGVIDQQTNIVFVCSENNIISANKSFFKFFNVNSLDQFRSDHKHISNTFIHHKNFFSLKDKSKLWISEIQRLTPENRIVSIIDLQRFEPKAFNVQISNLDSNNDNFVVTFTDITEIKLESQKYHYHATHDALTRIYNRSYYFDKISQEINYAQRYDTSFSIILFDIDHFKKFNDTYGHLKGDEVLVAVTSLINKNIRASDTLARWGGEEFIILLEKTTIDTAELMAENFRQLIEDLNIKDVGTVTSSFGVTQFKPNDTQDTILKRADEALYKAKEAGRNTVISN